MINKFLKVEERLDEIGCELIISNSEYKEASTKYNEIFGKIQESLSEEVKNQLMKIDSLAGQQQAIAEEIMYTQGFKDGANFQLDLKSENA